MKYTTRNNFRAVCKTERSQEIQIYISLQDGNIFVMTQFCHKRSSSNNLILILTNKRRERKGIRYTITEFFSLFFFNTYLRLCDRMVRRRLEGHIESSIIVAVNK